MSKIFRLVYSEFGSSHIEEETKYYTEVIGAQPTETTADSAKYLSLGLDHHNIVLRPAEQTGNLVNGFQLTKNLALQEFSKQMVEQGLQPKYKTDARPGVSALIELRDIAGHNFEFFSEMQMPAPGFAAHGIAPNRLGHVALLTPEAPKLVTFFADVLGFHTTDWFDDVATFLTCNRDHHVLNIIAAPITKLHHIAFEMRGSGHQYEASDQLAKANLPIVWGPSRHTAGHNYASYHFDPDHTLVEFYADMDVYLPDLGIFEPRPWHEKLPLRPQKWSLANLNAWSTSYDFDFSEA